MRKTTTKRIQLNSSKVSPKLYNKIANLVTDAIFDNLQEQMNDIISLVSNELKNDPEYNEAWMGLYDARFSGSITGSDMVPDIEDRINKALDDLRAAWFDFYLYRADEDVNSSRRVNSNRGSHKLNSSRQLPYQAISIPVILRDWVTLNDGDYFSRKHQKLVDIGDTLYNDGMEMAEYLKPEYKELYEEFGEAFWKQVIEDAAAIDSQMSREKVEELDQEYTDLSFRVM